MSTRRSRTSTSRRKSGRSSSYRKSYVQQEDDDSSSSAVDEEDNEAPPMSLPTMASAEKIVFDFGDGEDDLWFLEKNEDIVMISAGEESENENQKPCDKALGANQAVRNHQVPLSSPLKRASPLSPTLLDNVRPPQQQPVFQPGLLPESLSTSPSSKEIVEEESNADDGNVGFTTRSKRRRMDMPSTEKVVAQESSKTCPEETSQDASAPEYKISLPVASFKIIDDYNIPDAPPMDKDNYLKTENLSAEHLCLATLYELDEIDLCWLSMINEQRAKSGLRLRLVEPEEMELVLDRFEKEHYFEMQNSGLTEPGESDEDAVCCICLIGESDNSNLIIFCDMCNIAVHQECYGVPYVPEGSWICRRCGLQPNGDIECVLCPSKEGAFKPTEDGRWAHVICALWIPEVRFGNPSFWEPVEDVDKISVARLRLICVICKRKGVGACIQCRIRACVTAFHLTCAQEAGYKLKMQASKQGEADSQSTDLLAYCDKHTTAVQKEKYLKKFETMNKILKEKRASQPETYLSLKAERVHAITDLITVPGKFILIKRLLSYWKLRRKSRSGAPFIRDLEPIWRQLKARHQYPPMPPPLIINNSSGVNEVETSAYNYQEMYSFRNELDKFRELVSMVKTKCLLEKEHTEIVVQIQTLRMQREDPIYLEIINKLDKKDTRGIFIEPVQEEDAPDYFTVISSPMDISTMRTKALGLEYENLDELEADFNLIVNNCMTFNNETTMFYKAAVRMKDYGDKIFQEVRLNRKQSVPCESTSNIVSSKVRTTSTITNTTADDSESADTHANTKERKTGLLKDVLADILKRLTKLDTKGLFDEPVDIDEVPDYLSIVEKPMDFSTMQTKLDSGRYFCIEDLEVDFHLIVDNCMLYNTEETKYYQDANKLKERGQEVIDKAKSKNKLHCRSARQEDTSTQLSLDSLRITSETVPDDQDDLNTIMTEVLEKLIERDTDGIFGEPVSLEDVPDYFSVIKTPMDLSLMKTKLQSSLYLSLDEMQVDFNLMIENCKCYNEKDTPYFKAAVALKKAGEVIFRYAKKRVKID